MKLKVRKPEPPKLVSVDIRSSRYRGHRMYFDELSDEWRYTDDDTFVKDYWQLRPCGHCGLGITPEGHDGCLGTLPNVINACCGHGVVKAAYVQFSKHCRISGQEAINWIEQVH